jgi:hypothetical protein
MTRFSSATLDSCWQLEIISNYFLFSRGASIEISQIDDCGFLVCISAPNCAAASPSSKSLLFLESSRYSSFATSRLSSLVDCNHVDCILLSRQHVNISESLLDYRDLKESIADQTIRFAVNSLREFQFPSPDEFRGFPIVSIPPLLAGSCLFLNSSLQNQREIVLGMDFIRDLPRKISSAIPSKPCILLISKPDIFLTKIKCLDSLRILVSILSKYYDLRIIFGSRSLDINTGLPGFLRLVSLLEIDSRHVLLEYPSLLRISEVLSCPNALFVSDALSAGWMASSLQASSLFLATDQGDIDHFEHGYAATFDAACGMSQDMAIGCLKDAEAGLLVDCLNAMAKSLSNRVFLYLEDLISL